MDKSRTSKSVVTKRMGLITVYQYPHELSILTWPNTRRKSFGRPIKAKSRIGQPSPWIRHGKGKK